MFEQLFLHIKKSVSLTAEDENIIKTYFSSKDIAKKDFLLQEGSLCKYNYFILKGCFRLYIITENGREQVIQFGLENWWITDYVSFSSGQPSKFYIQALERSEVLYYSKEKEEELFLRVPKIESYFRKNLERAYTASLIRIQYIFALSGEDRYSQFAKLYPGFIQRVPQYMLASFLGLTPEYLSEIRKKNTK